MTPEHRLALGLKTMHGAEISTSYPSLTPNAYHNYGHCSATGML